MCMQHQAPAKPQPKKYRTKDISGGKKHQILNRDALERGDKNFVDERVRKTILPKKSFFQKLFS